MATASIYFSVRSVEYTETLTGYIVTCTTNNPIHLWLRWTAIEPQKHVNERIVRGAPIGTYIDQCFVVYNDVEQNEPGDTLTHTFTLEPWLYCQTRWFYFYGTISGVLSPSRSAIFQYHSTASAIYGQRPQTGQKYYYGCSCVSRSFPIIPDQTFVLRYWYIHLARRPYWNAPNTVEIFIHYADDNGKPTTNKTSGSLTGFTLPMDYSWYDCYIPMQPATLHAGNKYATSIRFSKDYKFTQTFMAYIDGGTDGAWDWYPDPQPGAYHVVTGYGLDFICYDPPGDGTWTLSPVGGRRAFTAYGTPNI